MIFVLQAESKARCDHMEQKLRDKLRQSEETQRKLASFMCILYVLHFSLLFPKLYTRGECSLN
jgi:uncharacterized paraquat-inducible protein A